MLLWYAAGLIAAVAIAWLAAVLHLSGHAPIGILSLGTGIVLGMVLSAIAAARHRPQGGRAVGRRRLVVGTAILALVTVVAEHAWLYRDFRRQWHEARATSAEVAMFRPEEPWSVGEYFRRELTPRRAALWCLDAALITAAAVGTVLAFDRQQQ
jgi:hypothetical protein